MMLIQKTAKNEKEKSLSKESIILNTNNKSYAEYVASKTDLSPEEALYYTNIIFSVIMDAIKDGKIIAIHGFGSFSRAVQKSMRVFHQPTQKYIDVPEKFKIKFKAHNNIKKYINMED